MDARGILFDKVSFAYEEHIVLQDITLSIEEGEFICLLGPSGAGKSSFVRLLAGLSSATSGVILINGTEVTEPGLDRGIVFQDYTLFPWMSAGENIVLALKQAFPERDRRELRAVAEEFLDLVGLDNTFHKLPGEMSGGMRQRAAIARAFAMNPPILLLDEPFGAVDAVTRAKLQDLLLQLWQQENERPKTIIFVTHDVDEAIILASRVVVIGMNPGRIKTVRAIDLPRPRRRDLLYHDERFRSLRNELVELLQEDVVNQLSTSQTVLPPGDRI
ncbi:MAG: Bicarbonate transport ATP-binding protein CmpD [Syntrophorhabdaceae bacterium PtaU1.Bin034]|nr:MAG: Bicarbonate transport ATP-binding protein CmpD [Syntrophorhabdaceae bacterium PtaU1.Bin034]